jgi:hypothetical protein
MHIDLRRKNICPVEMSSGIDLDALRGAFFCCDDGRSHAVDRVPTAAEVTPAMGAVT